MYFSVITYEKSILFEFQNIYYVLQHVLIYFDTIFCDLCIHIYSFHLIIYNINIFALSRTSRVWETWLQMPRMEFKRTFLRVVTRAFQWHLWNRLYHQQYYPYFLGKNQLVNNLWISFWRSLSYSACIGLSLC